MTKLLDVSLLPFEQKYALNGQTLGLSRVIEAVQSAVWRLSITEPPLVEKNMSFGFAMGDPKFTKRQRANAAVWDVPENLAWLVGGWGAQRDRYVANAVRKLRPACRTGKSTLDLSLNDRELFLDEVESECEPGQYPWGDYPWGGATWVDFWGNPVPVAVGCLSEEEGPALAALIGSLIASELHKARKHLIPG